MRQINIHEAKTHLSKIIDRVLEGEEVIIARNNKPLVKLVKIAPAKKKRQIGRWKGRLEISPDFDAPLDDFREYM